MYICPPYHSYVVWPVLTTLLASQGPTSVTTCCTFLFPWTPLFFFSFGASFWCITILRYIFLFNFDSLFALQFLSVIVTVRHPARPRAACQCCSARIRLRTLTRRSLLHNYTPIHVVITVCFSIFMTTLHCNHVVCTCSQKKVQESVLVHC